MGRKLAVDNVWVTADVGSDPVLFSEGDEVPEWAAKQMGEHCLKADDGPDPTDLDGDGHDDANPDKPAGNASLAAWQEYATAQGENVEDLTRDEIRDLFA